MRDGERKKRKNARKDIEVTEKEEPARVFNETLLLLLLYLYIYISSRTKEERARVFLPLSLVISLSFTLPHPAASNP